MKQKDNIEQLFERLEGTFDIHDTPIGHQRRYLKKLQDYKMRSRRLPRWWGPMSIAATVLLLLAVGLFYQNTANEPKGLASVSPEMEQTQSFFTTAISAELETLKSFENEETSILIDDTLQRLEFLETEYDQLKTDLVESGNDKRVISAMIANFQNRIELLQQVIENIEEIKTLKANRNETTI
jgi:hypothetical protein